MTVATLPVGDAAAVEGRAVRDVVTASIIFDPTIAAIGGRCTPERFFIRLVAPGSIVGLNDNRAEQDGTDDEQGL
ncbi:hypothetical protein BGZ65_007479, partial [Modicella reniformis]